MLSVATKSMVVSIAILSTLFHKVENGLKFFPEFYILLKIV